MSQDQPGVGERRRRREAERAAAPPAEERPLTRRELRAREAALATGALELDHTGEIRVIRESDGPPVEEPAAVTGTVGMTRRELRELRQQATEVASAPSAATPPRGVAASATASPGPLPSAAPTPPAPDAAGTRADRAVPPAAAPITPAPSAPAAGTAAVSTSSSTAPATSTPAPSASADRAGAARPAGPIRRPVVRPPASAAVRSLADDGAGLGPAIRDVGSQDSGTATSWSTTEQPAVDVTDAGGVPAWAPVTTGNAAASNAAPPSATTGETPTIDEVIAGETHEPEPFAGRPSWAELPPATPSGAVPVVSAAAESPAETTQVVPPPTPAPVAAAAPAPVAAVEPEDDDEDEDDDHHTPGWLTALMIVVMLVIAVVLGLLVYRVVTGDGATGAAAVEGIVDVMRAGTL